MFSEASLLPLSALQHLLYCERQCALIHIEQAWVENRYTAEGRLLHDRVDIPRSESRRDIRQAFAVALCSSRLGLVGKADVVEFHRVQTETTSAGSRSWRPFPVEYKRGRPKKRNHDKVQLCAQALCLEEMLSTEVPEGALYYGKIRRRTKVAFDASLRRQTEAAAQRLHALVSGRRTPPAVYSPACDNCSFLESCLPKTLNRRSSVRQYLKEVIDLQ
ncbi:CRISPR-associated protein Cas4 [Desulfatitalea alkaliphila]|uniref:CRISPR-associated exonuclease Cas4 n=1 Tax=Desulfatitalea alkaliphila TaxID=2929485 RepID=A0AA41R5A8_9BACT|nr:CRISPR-associated protein Cas4 [Desulfatitalea alkaliphila]MCJ8503089.1 CRISPR-associated protein Cas4 [Desulfatitalea alkaliphila]